MGGEPRLFALSETAAYGQRVAGALGMPLSPHEERRFEDGEHKARPLVSVRGCDVYVLHSLYGEPGASANDKLLRALFFIGALKDAAAARVTLVAPYLCYMRKDRKTKPRDPVITRYVASVIEAAGADRVVAMDVHNVAAFENAFRCPVEHLEAKELFVDCFVPLAGVDPVTVVSPDVGGVKRAEALRLALAQRLKREPAHAFVEKYRSDGTVSGGAVVGEMEGRVALILDDLVSTGGTLARAAASCRRAGATRVYAAATHGLFVGDAAHVLGIPDIDRIVVTDTVPPWRLPEAFVRDRLVVLDTAPLVAAAIARMHRGGSGS